MLYTGYEFHLSAINDSIDRGGKPSIRLLTFRPDQDRENSINLVSYSGGETDMTDAQAACTEIQWVEI